MTNKLYSLAVAMLFLISCGNTDKKISTSKPEETKESKTPKNAASGFDITKIPLSDKQLDAFPYLAAPEGYEYKWKTDRDFERKFYYYDDSLVRAVEGKYFYSSLSKKQDNPAEYGKTFVLKSYEDAIENLGGVQFFAGTLSDQARDLLESEKPEFFNDLSKNFAIRYKQYVLRTEEANIWFELAAIDNENEIRVSVIREEVAKP